MSRNGDLALKKVIFSYNPSKGMVGLRQFFATHLPLFKSKYPSVTVELRPRQWAERSITGVYADGSERAYNINDMSSMGIWTRCHKLVNTANDFELPFTGNHVHLNRRSVQGSWNPWLWVAEANHKSRVEQPNWDRKLSEPEWAYFVEKYATEQRLQSEAVERRVEAKSLLSGRNTAEAARRWREHVAPKLQTDMEHNLDSFKAAAKRGQKQKPVTMGEYRLFALPQTQELGQDALEALRRKEHERFEQWWVKRKEQLKPPA